MSQSFSIRLRTVIRQDSETGAFVSHIPVLDLYSAGKTEEEAVEAAQSAVDMFFDVATDKGTLEQVLLETGLLNTGERQQPSTLGPSTDRIFDTHTPLHLQYAIG